VISTAFLNCALIKHGQLAVSPCEVQCE
jgi:hypothetical protein